MTRTKRAVGWTVLFLMVAAAGVLAQTAQGQFVPVTPGTQQETLPAAPLVFIAYGFVWVALAAYVVLLWRRLAKVERELVDLNARLKSAHRS
jgi:CcmD family protein